MEITSVPSRVLKKLVITCLTVTEVLDVNVGTQPDVKRQVPADVVGVVINHDLVTVPYPIVAISEIIRGNAEIESPEPETAGSTARQMPNMAGPESARKVPVLPGVIEVVVGISRAAIVPDPFAIGVNVRSIGVPGASL
jgi:hypothetical protein